MVASKDNGDDKDESEEKKEELLVDLSLDQVHEKVVADLEDDDSEEEDDENKEEADDGDKEPDEEEDSGGDDDGDGAGERDDSIAESKTPEVPEVPDPKVPEPKTPEPTPELDTDTTKDGPNKVAVKDYDDNTHYFNSLDEVPEDFEPRSYKEFARFVQSMTEKEQSDKKRAAEEAEAAAEAERSARIQSIKDEWDRDIKSLVEENRIPKDEKERQPVIDAVFDIMNKKLERGKVIDFETGFEIYSAQERSDAKKEVIKKSNEDKKKRGGMVVGAGSGSNASSKSRVIEGPPAGVTLDDVHASVLNDLD